MFRLQQISQKIKKNQFIYSVPIGQKKPGQSYIHRHVNSKNSLFHVPNNIHSLAQFWDDIANKYSSLTALQKIKYYEVDVQAKRLGSWLYTNQHNKIYIYCKNSPQWTITDISCWNYAIVNIPLYDTFGEQAFFHIMELTEGTIICITAQMYSVLFDRLKKHKYALKSVIFFDRIPENAKNELNNLNLNAFSFKQLVNPSQNIIARPKQTLDNHLTYAFTSGTTGLPKGVITTHRNAITQILAMDGLLQNSTQDVHLSYLPIAHTFERFVTWTTLKGGSTIKYSYLPPTQIVKQMIKNKPTTIPMVPRLLNKLYAVCKPIVQRQGQIQGYKKIKALFGGKLVKMVTGSAPISPEILKFFRECLNCDIRQGYGQTQTTAASFVTYEGDYNYGHVGGPNKSVQFKLIDVPEMNYLTNGITPKGQVCMRGDSIFIGYYKDYKNTEQTLDSQGWNHSGDIGQLLPNGALRIIDRKKNIYKLSQGQYIAPEKIENVYLRCPYVAQCFVYGDSLRDYNVAIVHPSLQLLPRLAEGLKIEYKSIQQLCLNHKVISFILQEMNKQGKKDNLNGIQCIKKLTLSSVSFVNLKIFTSTMKLQRYIAKKQFAKMIQKMYLS